MSELYSDSIFWVEVGKIRPNPYQPRRQFDDNKLRDLSDSIRQYGVLQPLVVTRHEVTKPDGGIAVEYELIAGERRLRASKLAHVSQVPVIIRTGEDNSKMKLELAIIENLQREDLNPVDRAKAFLQFIDEFGLKHTEIAKKVGKSREYVSNSLRLLSLPQIMLDALAVGKISEGHARALMMLKDTPDQQLTIFKEVMFKKLTVRETEGIARSIAKDKVRKKVRQYDPEIMRMEEELTEKLGTRVQIESREVGGKITIDFFSDDDLRKLLEYINENKGVENEKPSDLMQKIEDSTPITSTVATEQHHIHEEIIEYKEDEYSDLDDEIEFEVPQKIVDPNPISVEEFEQVKETSSQPQYQVYNSIPPAPVVPFIENVTHDITDKQDSIKSQYEIYQSIPTEPVISVTDHNADSISDNQEKKINNSVVVNSQNLINDNSDYSQQAVNSQEIEYNSEDSFDSLIEGAEKENNEEKLKKKRESDSDTDMYSVHNFSI